MKKFSVRYQDDDFDVIIHVEQANVRMGVTRSTIIGQQLRDLREREAAENAEPIDVVERVIATMTYPVCIAATTMIENPDAKKPMQLQLPLTLAEFMNLPDGLAYVWEEAALRVNPHWSPRAQTGEPQESSTIETSSADA